MSTQTATSPSEENKAAGNTSGNESPVKDTSGKTKLMRGFTFWFSVFKQGKTKLRSGEYEETIRRVGSFDTIEDFWMYYQHIRRPDTLPSGVEFYLFQEGIRPMWEDEANRNGGKFVLRIQKTYANRFWEDLILSFIGEQSEDNDDICGLILSVRNNEIVISVWTKSLFNSQARRSLGDWMRKTLELSDRIEIEYKEHPNEYNQGGQSSHQGTQGGRYIRNDYKPKKMSREEEGILEEGKKQTVNQYARAATGLNEYL
eukprot:TRINITY_DN5770_c0_g1_i1.p1 TRINITY_DN5770_c0_g1~~TRINITY_DN5770_c0_g1_i1.p1  ORF type:complete len:258 (+),score=52.02 TRINITY_DN5770_c0_g1_i1:157-930(+)